MIVSEQDVVLSDCVREFPCLYDKGTPEYHQRGVTGNCWKEVANKAGLENGTPGILKSYLLRRRLFIITFIATATDNLLFKIAISK